MTRCSWCEREAMHCGSWVEWCGSARCGDASYGLTMAFVRAAWRREEPTPETERETRDADREVRARDARELRGEPPSMEGWVLW